MSLHDTRTPVTVAGEEEILCDAAYGSFVFSKGKTAVIRDKERSWMGKSGRRRKIIETGSETISGGPVVTWSIRMAGAFN